MLKGVFYISIYADIARIYKDINIIRGLMMHIGVIGEYIIK